MTLQKDSMERVVLPFTAIVNVKQLKLALLVNAINPHIGGLLISGPKGTGKTTVVRALAALLPEVQVVADCLFHCDPTDPSGLCNSCREKHREKKSFVVETRQMRVVDLPLSATEDRVVGSLDVERAIREGVAALKPGILASANQNILYVDEVNLLPDHIIDALLDAAATGVNVVEREGVSVHHPARFILVGSMNPEEGELRPQLLDRFPLHANIDQPLLVEERIEVIRRNLDFDRNPLNLHRKWAKEEEKLREEIKSARERLKKVIVPDSILTIIAKLCSQLQVDGVRPDIVIAKTAMAHAALNKRNEVTMEDIHTIAPLALSHRTRQKGILEPPTEENIAATLEDIQDKVDKVPKPAPAKEAKIKGEKRGLLNRIRSISTPPSKDKGTPSTDQRSGRFSFNIYCAVVGFLITYFVMAAGFHYALMVSFPTFGILNFFIALSLPLVVLVFFALLFHRFNPGGLSTKTFPQEATPKDKQFRLIQRKYASKSSQPPLVTAARPPKDLTSLPTAKETRYPSISLPAKLDVDEGQPLFHPPDLAVAPFFSRHPLPKWSIRQHWRRAGSTRTHISDDGVIIGAKIPHGIPHNIHLPASIAAASLPLISSRKRKSRAPKGAPKLAVQISSRDVREKRFHSRSPLTIIFVVDLSVSMVRSLEKLRRSILAFKACLEGTRDRVGLVVLKDFGATEIQAPTTNWTRLIAGLLSLHLSGFTPLAAGLAKARETLRREKRRNPRMAPLIVLFSDFMPNIRLRLSDSPDIGLAEPIADMFHQCHLLALERIPIAAINLHQAFSPLTDISHHAAVVSVLHRHARDLQTTNLIEVGLQKNLLIPFLGFYVAYLTGGRVFLGEEISAPSQVIPAIIQLTSN